MSDNKGKSWDEVVEEIANGVYLEMQSGPIKRKSKKEIQYKAEEYRNKSNNNGIRYINDDKLVRKPQKVMAKITKEELWNLMIENAGNENDKKTVLQLAIDKCKIDLETIYVEDKDYTKEERENLKIKVTDYIMNQSSKDISNLNKKFSNILYS